jgi:hypothetical protein
MIWQRGKSHGLGAQRHGTFVVIAPSERGGLGAAGQRRSDGGLDEVLSALKASAALQAALRARGADAADDGRCRDGGEREVLGSANEVPSGGLSSGKHSSRLRRGAPSA